MLSDETQIPIAIDHVGFVARDLFQLSALFKSLGFNVTPPNSLMAYDEALDRSVPLGQQSAHAVFEQGYLEFTAPTGENLENHLYPLLEKWEGPHILAFATANAIHATQNPLLKTEITEPFVAKREVHYGANPGIAKFKWFPLAANEFPEAYACGVEHLTPDIVFQKEVSGHANGVVALTGVEIETADITPRREAYQRISPVFSDQISTVHESSAITIREDPRAIDARIRSIHFLTSDLQALRDQLTNNDVTVVADDKTQLELMLPSIKTRLRFKANE